MKNADFEQLSKSAERYMALLTFLSNSPDRNLESDQTTINAVMRDFQFVATPTAVSGLFRFAQQLQQELTAAQAAADAAKRECADMADVMVVSGSVNVISLPLPRIITAQGLEVMTVADIVQALRRQGFDVRGVTL